jgi:glycine oxidase
VAADVEVIVVGAGIIGCAIAHQLSRRDARVRVFESRSVAAGATHASAGVLAPYIEAPEPGPLLDLAVRSLRAYDSFVSDVTQDAGVAVEYRICGTLDVALDSEGATRLKEQADAAAQMAGVTAEWFDAASAAALDPSLPATVAGALLIREHGYVAASQLAEALTWAALRHGAEFETGRRVTRIEQRRNRLAVSVEDGASWIADRVVIAAGSWASQAGIDEAAARAVRPVRGQLLQLAWQASPPRYVIWGPSCYIVPWSDGTVLVGATVEDVGFDERTTASGVHQLLDAACALLPAAAEATFREARAGLRPASLDGLPIVGPSPTVPGVIYATGHYRNGVLLAPITAQIVSDLILKNRRDPALRSIGPERFGR